MRPRWLLAVVGLLVLPGCSGTSHTRRSASITVYAASSLTDTFTTLARGFEKQHRGVHVVLNFGASSALATSITNGAHADVFASAAGKNMTSVVKAGEATNPVPFAVNTMEIAARSGNPAHVASVADLSHASVKVALCDPAVPCGVAAAKVLRAAHVTVKPVSLEADVRSTLAKVELGEVDAAVVYVTDVRAAGTKVVGVPIPATINATTAYPIATLKAARDRGLAQSFVRFVLSRAGRSVLAGAGFQAP